MDTLEERIKTRLTAEVLNYVRDIKLPNTSLIETGKDTKELQITDDIEEEAFLRENLSKSKRLQQKKTNAV